MKVYNLACEAGHRFEGWFGSAEDHADQERRGLLRCPVCDSAGVRKLPAAPRLNLGAATASGVREAATAPAAAGGGEGARPVASAAGDGPLRAALMQALHKLVTDSEDVGERFAEVARKIHYGEDEARNIRGVATEEERTALADEGIDVLTLPWAAPAKGSLQ